MTRVFLSRLATALVAAAGLLSVGCIKASDDVTVTSDGSGTFSETTSIDLSAFKGLEEMFKGMNPGGDPGAAMEGDKPAGGEAKKEDPLEKLKREWKEIPGLELTKSSAEEKDGKFTERLEAKFKTLEAYARGTQIEFSADLKKNDDGSYTLRFFGGEAAQADDAAMGDAAMGDGGPDMAAAMMPMLEKFLGELELTRKLTLPGKVIETNGTKGEDGSTVSWTVKFADLKSGKPPKQTVTFKGDGLDLKPFSIKREQKPGAMK